jgi:anti-sigma factor RsiW
MNDTPALTWSCADFESALSAYREGTLAAPEAAFARAHLAQCPACAGLLDAVALTQSALAALPQREPSPRFLAEVLARTLPPRHRPAAGLRGFWAGLVSPRFALGLAMSVFAVALLLNAAQVNLAQVFRGNGLSQLAPASLAASLQRQWDRAWARGVSYYHDLRFVYEIEAAIHQMQQPAPASGAPAAPGGAHNRSQRAGHAVPDAQLAMAYPVLPPRPYRRLL